MHRHVHRAAGFAFVLIAIDAASYTLVEDSVGGSCKKMVEHQQSPGVGLDGQHFAGKWGITVPNLYIGAKRVDDPDAIDEVHVEFAPATRDRGRFCVVTKAVRFTLRADSRVGAIEWLHGQKPKACIDEWNRVRSLIRTHEPKHVKDIEDLVAAANGRVANHAAVRACAATEDGARTAIARQILAMIQTEVATIKSQAAVKARALDSRENAFMNCKLCEGGLAFKDVTVDCTIPTPRCSVRMGQTIAGRVCGDPITGTWTITPHYFSEGCGVPPSGTKGDKPFTNDCVAEGSAEEKQRVDAHRRFAAAGGAGGWMCVYRDGPTPKIVIRNFRMAMCKPSTEQTITVDAEPTDCD